MPAPAAWSGAALGGCLAELSGAGAAPSLTLAFGLVGQVQRQDEPVAWITRAGSTFFPPDAAEGGVDLAALPVIRLDGVRQRLRAADQLARSGAFGLIVIDLGDRLDLPLAVQTRLAEQALAHGTLILCLTAKTERQPSLGRSSRFAARRGASVTGRIASPARCTRSRTSGAVRAGSARSGVVDRMACVELRRSRSSSC